MILIALDIDGCVYTYNDSKKLILKTPGALYNYNQKYVAIKRNSIELIIDIYSDAGNRICTYPYDLVDTDNIQGLIL